MKKEKFTIKYFFALFDGVWSVPLAFVAFWLVGLILTAVFDFAAGTYDIGFVQPLFLAAGIVIGASNISVAGMYFTFRGLFRFFYGYTDRSGLIINESKNLWKDLSPSFRFGIAFTVFFSFFWGVILVYLALV